MEKIKVTTIRDAVYKTGDGITALVYEIQKHPISNDPTLTNLVLDLDDALARLKAHLDKKYLWD
jgi:hypothetical protein